MRYKGLVITLGLFVAWALLQDTWAQQDAAPDLQLMVSQANAIFLGVCVRAQSRWDDATRMILTDYTFGVEQYLKGNLGPTVTITEPGGVLPELNLVMTMSHMPKFRDGEEVVLFVWTDPQGTYRVLGAEHGKYSVALDAASSARSVQNVSLETFLRRITAHVQKGQGE